MLAVKVAAHAVRVLPARRADWAKAMCREIDYIANDADALVWALGCVFASYSERTRTMKIGTLLLSRWVLGVEVLVCFVPACVLFFAIVAASEAGRMPPADALLYLSAAAIGPLGLAVGGALVARNRSMLGRVPTALLAVTAVWTLLAFCEQAGGALAAFTQSWREFVLIVLLPAVGTAHLLVVVRHRKAQVVSI